MASHPQLRASWQQKLDNQQASGLSITAWCVQQDIRPQTFYYWRKRLALSTPAAPMPPWVALTPTREADSRLIVRVGQVAIEVMGGFAPDLLGEVLTVLEARC